MFDETNVRAHDLALPSMYNGRIHLILGPMFSGKTTELLRNMERLKFAKYRTCLVTYSLDTRYHETPLVASHSGLSHTALNCTELRTLTDKFSNYDAIGIDEAHFFPDIVEVCEMLANRGHIVIVAGLDGTYQRKGFGDFLSLVPLSEKVEKLNAVCILCGNDAAFTTRTVDNSQVHLIGGTEKYIATCRKCYMIYNP